MDSVVQALRGRPRCVLLDGALGVGKTVLARLVADELGRGGWHVETCAGAPSAAAIPFGTLSRFLPHELSGDPALTLEQTRRRVVASANDAPLLLLVDDVHHLDPGSLTLLDRLVRADDAAVLMTLRSGEPLDGAITALWKDGQAERVEVPPLDRAAHDALVAAVLGDASVAGLADRLWSVTHGNPLFLREFLLQRLASDSEGGEARPLSEWDLEAEIEPSPLLTSIIQTRVAGVSEGARDAVELIALAAPIRLDVVMRLTDRESLAELEERRLIAIATIGDTAHVVPGHPVFAETIRASLGPLRRAALAGRVASALIDDGLAVPGAALEAATWLREANEEPPPGLALRAAREALAQGDAGSAERLVRPAADLPEVGALVVLGTALSVQHRIGEARAALDRASALASSDEEGAAVALALARHLLWMEHEFAAATNALGEAIAGLTEPAARAELQAELAICAAVSGNAHETVRIAGEVLDEPAAEPRVTLSALVQSTLARTMLGQFGDLESDLDRADALAEDLREHLPLASGQLAITRAMWQRFVNLDRAASIAVEAWRRATSGGGGAAFCSAALAWIESDRGDVDEALRLANRAVSEARTFDPFHNLPMSLALIALASALRGETDVSRQALTELGDLDRLEPRTRTFADRAAVWSGAHAPAKAAALAVAAGQRAEAGTMVAWAAPLYHDAVRLGHPERAVRPLSLLAATIDSPVIAAMARHARAAVDGNVFELAAAAEDFLACGSRLLAAEALSQATASAAAGTPQAAWLATRAAHLASSCAGAATPPITQLASPLSARETEIGAVAASGLTSPEIASRLSLSVRTVDNHLASVYRKLGLHAREELRAVFPRDADGAAEAGTPRG